MVAGPPTLSSALFSPRTWTSKTQRSGRINPPTPSAPCEGSIRGAVSYHYDVATDGLLPRSRDPTSNVPELLGDLRTTTACIEFRDEQTWSSARHRPSSAVEAASAKQVATRLGCGELAADGHVELEHVGGQSRCMSLSQARSPMRYVYIVEKADRRPPSKSPPTSTEMPRLHVLGGTVRLRRGRHASRTPSTCTSTGTPWPTARTSRSSYVAADIVEDHQGMDRDPAAPRDGSRMPAASVCRRDDPFSGAVNLSHYKKHAWPQAAAAAPGARPVPPARFDPQAAGREKGAAETSYETLKGLVTELNDGVCTGHHRRGFQRQTPATGRPNRPRAA